jgi:thiamine pyrophosphate-dependent acetolactate synthase large subunit-like protein
MRADEPLRRREVVARLVADRGDLLVVTGLGSTTYDVGAAGDHALNFYLWGAMGSAVPIGLGLALAQPQRRVLVITGDGEMLMGLGALATVAAKQPRNLAVAVIDNEQYGETGMQATHTAAGIDLAGMAAQAGFPVAVTVAAEARVADAMAALRTKAGPVFVVFKVSQARDPLVLPPRDGAHLKHRFREALLGQQAIL